MLLGRPRRGPSSGLQRVSGTTTGSLQGLRGLYDPQLQRRQLSRTPATGSRKSFEASIMDCQSTNAAEPKRGGNAEMGLPHAPGTGCQRGPVSERPTLRVALPSPATVKTEPAAMYSGLMSEMGLPVTAFLPPAHFPLLESLGQTLHQVRASHRRRQNPIAVTCLHP